MADLLNDLHIPKLRNDDDVFDRLNRRYTPIMLILFAIMVTTEQYVGDPIQCWAPNHFSKGQVAYTNDYCWMAGTYYHSFNRTFLGPEERDTIERLTYYQWVPIILLIQAILFHAPHFLWICFVEQSGLDVNSVVVTGEMLSTVQMEAEPSMHGNDTQGGMTIRDGLLRHMAVQINRYLSSFNVPKKRFTLSWKFVCSRTMCSPCGHGQGNYLLSLYLIVKALYVVNAIGQLFALDIFLTEDFHGFGIDAIKAWIRGDDFTASQRFPRVTMCDFKLRRLGTVQRYSVQCVLPVNLFNEKIYLFLWFWLIFIAITTFVSLMVWTIRSVVPLDRTRYIKKHLQLAKKISVSDSEERKIEAVKFVEKFLRQDGVFLLRLLQKTTNAITAMEVTSALWDMFIPNAKEARPNGVAKPLLARKQSAPVVDYSSAKHRTPTAPHPKELEANNDL